MLLRFLGCEFDVETGELKVEGRRLRLEPQPAKVLALVASRAGEVVSREDLQRELWPAETYVDAEQGINYCIRRVRAALADSANAPRFIETLPKRGYRFLPAVEVVPDAPVRAGRRLGRRSLAAAALVAGAVVAAGVAWMGLGRVPPSLPTIAVTLFDNQTGRPELDRVAQIYTDVLVERLARESGRWSVIGNASILRTKRPFRHLEEIASSLHVQYIVLGQLEPGQKGVTVMTHLIRTRDQRHLWVGRTESPSADEVQAPQEVAERVATEGARLLRHSS